MTSNLEHSLGDIGYKFKSLIERVFLRWDLDINRRNTRMPEEFLKEK